MKSRTLLLFVCMLGLALPAISQTKISGTCQCGKPEPQNSIDVGDRANHSFMISKANCTWTRPIEMAGVAAKDGHSVSFDEVTVNSSSARGFFVGTMASGDKFTVRFQGKTTMKGGAPDTQEGKWSYTGGTGKLKGLTGEGTYKGKVNADGNVVFEIEGNYQVPAK